MQIGMHDPARPYPAQQDLRDAGGALRLPPREAGIRHPDDLECVPGRHPRLDQCARRLAQGVHLDGRAGCLSLLPQVLKARDVRMLAWTMLAWRMLAWRISRKSGHRFSEKDMRYSRKSRARPDSDGTGHALGLLAASHR